MSAALLEHFDLLAGSVGGVAKLRELILGLAVRGRLVPQDPGDEPASELLKRIRAEKDRLIQEGKIKRDKPLAAIGENEKPYELPEGWEWARLDEIGYTQTGGTPDKKEAGHFGTDIPFIKPGDLYPERVDYNNEGLSLSGAEALGRVAPPGTILMVCIGTIGKCNAIDRPCSFNQQINSISPLILNSHYLLSVLRSAYFQEEAWSRSSSTTIAILNKGKWESIFVPVAPLPEQSRIVAKVEELMSLCDRLEAGQGHAARVQGHWVEAALDQLAESADADEFRRHWQHLAAHFDTLFTTPASIDRLDAALLQLAVRGKLVPQDPTDEPASELLKQIRAEKDRLIAAGKIKRDKPLPPIADDEKPHELPDSWDWVRFDEIVEPNKPITYGVLVPGPDEPNGIPFVRLGDLSLTAPPSLPEKSISREVDAQYERTRLQGGEILMGVVGSIGKLGIAPNSWSGANIARAVCRIVPNNLVSKEFAILLLKSEFMQTNFVGDTRTVAQPTLNVGLIRSAMTPLPGRAEQSRIVAQVEKLQALTAALKTRLSAAQTKQAHLRDALIAEVC